MAKPRLERFHWPPVEPAQRGRPRKGERPDDRWVAARRAHLDAWKASGLSARAYALANGFRGGWVLKGWQSHIDEAERRAAARAVQISGQQRSTVQVPKTKGTR